MRHETGIAQFGPHACKEFALMLKVGKDARFFLLSIHKAFKRHTAFYSTHYEADRSSFDGFQELGNIGGLSYDRQELLGQISVYT